MSDQEPSPYHLFDVTGVEVEYMIVDRQTLQVQPIADRLIEAVSGSITSEFERGAIAWSNELTLHLVEFKTNGPTATLDGLADNLAAQVRDANAALEPFSACLLPTAMHPFMDPLAEMKLWPHDYDVVYTAFDRIFDCRGHGWANLQSVHINLPFANAEEFGRLHAAIRIVLPLLPALAASSPFAEGARTGWADTRLYHYRSNARRVPSVTGHVIPERLFTPEDYQKGILDRIYRDLSAYDSEGVLAHEWANARGAIARFDRDAIEIRLLDVQECPTADVAVVALVQALVKALVAETWSGFAAQKQLDEVALARVLEHTMRDGDAAIVDYAPLLEMIGLDAPSVPARHLWAHLIKQLPFESADAPKWQAWYELYAQEGCLAGRIDRAIGAQVDPTRLRGTYRRLAAGLAADRFFSLESMHTETGRP